MAFSKHKFKTHIAMHTHTHRKRKELWQVDFFTSQQTFWWPLVSVATTRPQTIWKWVTAVDYAPIDNEQISEY